MLESKPAGELLVEALEAQGIRRVYGVPGESYLPVLDALFESKIDFVNARHEGGAAMMAEAEGKLSGRPGIAMVTRGPGATNASCGLHIAQQDSTPLILFIGQVSREDCGREAFQEMDYGQFFGGIAKHVETLSSAERVPEVIARAFSLALAGRPGPVVIVLPEDVLAQKASAAVSRRIDAPEPSPSAGQMQWVERLLQEAKRPMVILGGSRWFPETVKAFAHWAEKWQIPVSVSFRRQQLFDHTHACYAGDVGIGINPKLKARLEEADLILLLGGRLGEIPSQGYSLLAVPRPGQKLIHVHPGAEELGKVYVPDMPINATPGTFVDRLQELNTPAKPAWNTAAREAHADYRTWSLIQLDSGASTFVDMGFVIHHMRETLEASAIITNGAGNYGSWLHRYWPFRQYSSQLAPISGSMGYGLPAAIAAKLNRPLREVVCFAGDGCFQMVMQELGTAADRELALIILVVDNGQYGTIRMHQEMHFPGRVSGTKLQNPDFVKIAEAYGAFAQKVDSNDGFPAALEAARSSGKLALLHLIVDPARITPSWTLDG